MTTFFSILIGYLLGSVSPAFFLGKILKGTDDNFTVGLISAGAMLAIRTLI